MRRELNWVNAVAARGGRILILQGPTVLDPARKIIATLRPEFLGTGSAAGVKIPGMAAFQARFFGAGARCHIIGAQLGGAGNVQANLFPCFQNRFNTPVKAHYETWVANELKNGNTITYSVELKFGANSFPDSVTMEASIIGGTRMFRVRIDNNSTAPVTNLP